MDLPSTSGSAPGGVLISGFGVVSIDNICAALAVRLRFEYHTPASLPKAWREPLFQVCFFASFSAPIAFPA